MKPNSIPSRRGQAGVSDEPPEAMRREDATLARPHAEADDDAVAAPVGQAGDQQAGEPAAAEVERAARGGEATQRHDGEPDRGAFHEFHQVAMTHERYLHRTAFRLSGDHDRAADLVQETFVRAWLRFHRFQRGSNVRAWLATILTRLFLDQCKHDKVVAKAGQEQVTRELADAEPDDAVGVSDAVLWQAVQALDPELRTIVELRYREDLSYQAIADRLQLPVGTVGTRLMRAHERLRILLGPPA